MFDYANTLLEKGGYANLTDEERIEVDAMAMDELRRIRNGLLKETDKYTISDWPLTDAERTDIIKYRQDLRDLTESQNPMFQEDGGRVLRNITYPSNSFVTDDVFHKYAPIVWT